MNSQAEAAINIILAVLVVYGDMTEESADHIIKKLNARLSGMKYEDIKFDTILKFLRKTHVR